MLYYIHIFFAKKEVQQRITIFPQLGSLSCYFSLFFMVELEKSPSCLSHSFLTSVPLSSTPLLPIFHASYSPLLTVIPVTALRVELAGMPITNVEAPLLSGQAAGTGINERVRTYFTVLLLFCVRTSLFCFCSAPAFGHNGSDKCHRYSSLPLSSLLSLPPSPSHPSHPSLPHFHRPLSSSDRLEAEGDD